MSGWTIGAVPLSTPGGTLHVPGWVRPPFGIDARMDVDSGIPVYVITHVPTGLSVCALSVPPRKLARAVDLLLTLGDWAFTDEAGIADYRDAMNVLRASGFEPANPARAGHLPGPEGVSA